MGWCVHVALWVDSCGYLVGCRRWRWPRRHSCCVLHSLPFDSGLVAREALAGGGRLLDECVG